MRTCAGLLVLFAARCTATAAPSVPLADAIKAAVTPALKSLSDAHNGTAWSFAYRDADVEVAFCVGFSNIATRTPCTTDDVFAWGAPPAPRPAGR